MVRILANTNPDIELVVGVDSGNSYTTMKDGINQVLKDIESRDPPKIKIHLDDTEINSKLQTLRNQIAALSENKISINIAGATQGVEKTIKSAISNYEQAYYFVHNKLNAPIATGQLERIKSALERNTELAREFYAALSQSYKSHTASQLIAEFKNLCREESNATNAAKQFGDIIKQQFEIAIPELDKFNEQGFKCIAVLKKFDKAMGGIGQYNGKDFFNWLESSATKAEKALFGFEQGYQTVQSLLRGLYVDFSSFMSYDSTLDLDTLTLKQDALKKLTSAMKKGQAETDAYNQKLSNLRQVLISTFNIHPQQFGEGSFDVTLQQLQQIVDQAPYAQEFIDRITSTFNRSYIPSEQIAESLNTVTTAEQSLETQTEHLGEAMNNAITSEAFDSKLGAINESIGQVSGSISTLAENISSALGGKAGAGSTLNIDQEALRGLEELLRGIYDLVEHSDMSKLNGEMSEVGEVAQRVAIYLGRYRDALNDAGTTKVHSSLTDLGIAAKDADVISKHLSDMNIKVKAITPEWETITKIIDEEIVKEQKLKQITVQGTTALGDAVNHVIKFSAKTGEISKELTKATVKGKEFTRTLADGTKVTNIETTVAELEEIDGLIKSIEKTNSTLNSSRNKVTDALGGLSTTGKNREELDAINKKFDELMVATERLKTNRMTANQEDVDGLRKVQEELDALIRKSQKRLELEAEADKKPTSTKVINFDLETQNAQASIDKITRRNNELKNSTEQVRQSVDALNKAFDAYNKETNQDRKKEALAEVNKRIQIANKLLSEQEALQKKLETTEKRTTREAAQNANKQNRVEQEANNQRKVALELLAKITKAQQEWTKARTGSTSNEYLKLQTYSNQLNTLLGQFASKSISKTDFSAQVKNVGDEFIRTSSVIRTAGEDTRTLADRFGSLTGKFSMWFSTTRIIMMVYTNIRKMISASIELDKSMNQLQIVTKENDEVMAKFGDTAAAAAKRIGSSITDFVSSATTYARLGYSLNESSQLAEFTAMLQNVGDIDVSQAQEAITSIVKAFNIGTDQIESVMDKMVVSGNNFPISVSQIAEGMKNASSALAAAGNSFDQSVALLTAANTTINLCRVA